MVNKDFHSNYGPTSHRFRDTMRYSLKISQISGTSSLFNAPVGVDTAEIS